MLTRRSFFALTLPALVGTCHSPRSPSENHPLQTSAAPAPAEFESVTLANIPHVRQKPDFCGEACAEMVMRKLSWGLTQDDVFAAADVDPALGRGAYVAELRRALERLGFDTGPVWHPIPDATPRAAEVIFAELHTDLLRDVPSIVSMRLDDSPHAREHFRLIVGFDAARAEVLFHDPAVEQGAYLRMKLADLMRRWPLPGTPTLMAIRIRMSPLGEAPTIQIDGKQQAHLAQHVIQLRTKLPGSSFVVHLEPPFVIVGDEPREVVQQHGTATVRWAADALKRAFFVRDPDGLIDVFLFRDAASYESNTLALFGRAPSTPYGFYASDDRALVMNIATGGGTLVHEMVHAFMESNFPEAPAWFNEGLGSLYEQCGERRGAIHGFPNWRLPGLQEAIRNNRLPSFATLLEMDPLTFYERDRGTNYAQARYLLYYLQEYDLLTRYYREFLAARHSDPTGLHTLKKVVKVTDLGAFQKTWERFILGLRFGP